MQTGLKGLDSVVGSLAPGEVWCVAGRPCVGKTALLIDVALRILQRHRTNVVFATAQEESERILLRLPPASMSNFVPLPSIDRLYEAIEAWPNPEPRVYLLDVQDVGASQAHCVAHRLNSRHPAGCRLLVSNGWSVDAMAPTLFERTVDGYTYRLEWERPARRLRARDLGRARRDAAAAGVTMLYGVCTASSARLESGPRVDDLRSLGSLLRRGEARAILLHRPELYLGHDEGRSALTGIVTLSSAPDPTGGQRQATLRYSDEDRRFEDVVRH